MVGRSSRRIARPSPAATPALTGRGHVQAQASSEWHLERSRRDWLLIAAFAALFGTVTCALAAIFGSGGGASFHLSTTTTPKYAIDDASFWSEARGSDDAGDDDLGAFFHDDPNYRHVPSEHSGAWNVWGDHHIAEGECPLCRSIFGRNFETTSRGDNLRNAWIQIRGEPRSGAGLVFERAAHALNFTCNRLEHWYGQGTCSLHLSEWSNSRLDLFLESAGDDDGPPIRTVLQEMRWRDKQTAMTNLAQVALEFQPWGQQGHRAKNAVAPAPCGCNGVDRVTIGVVNNKATYVLPVSKECPWQHVGGVTPAGRGCTTVGGRPIQNHEDTAECFHGNPCKVISYRGGAAQSLILRDPRAVVVSTYHHVKTNPILYVGLAEDGENVDSFAVRMLPTLCHFIHLRYLFFQAYMADRTMEFVYEEGLADPLRWHQRWLSSVGLHLPQNIVQEITDLAVQREVAFAANQTRPQVTLETDAATRTADGPTWKEEAPRRSFKEDLSSTVCEQLDDICRVWLPPVLLEKFGILRG